MVPGVFSADLNFATGTLVVEYDSASDPRDAVVALVERAGHGVEALSGAREVVPQSRGWVAENRTLVAVAGSGAFGLLGWALHLAAPGPVAVASAAAYVAACACGFVLLVPRAIAAARARALDMNVLMVVAVLGATLIGQFAEAAAVVFLFALGGWLEARAVARTRGSIRALMDLAPPVARVRREGVVREVAPADVGIGEVIVVRPGERVPLDGVVVEGRSAVDESPITGESVPADKAEGDAVYAGSLNTSGLLGVRVTAPATDSTLARIVYLVEEAQASRAPVQQLVDRFSAVYTPVVVAIAAAVWIVPVVASGQVANVSAWSAWLYRALVVLVTACPCALVISTPVTLVSAITRAGRDGVLVKGGAYLETAARTRAVAFDKTGTLTTGRLSIATVESIADLTRRDALALAASLEAGSTHPIARAVSAEAGHHGIETEPVTDFEELAGRGVVATLDGRRLVLVSPAFAEEIAEWTPQLAEAVAELESAGTTVLVLAEEGGPVLAYLGVADRPRQEAAGVVAALVRGGVTHSVLLTGDNERTAAGVAQATGVSAHMAGLLPADKVDAILRLKDRFGVVAMVGDGVNDAPALAAADLGVAMGAAGSDTALETADVALMSDDLAALPGFFALARRTLSIVVQNVVFSVVVKVAVVVLAIAGVANMWLAVFADTGVALLVILNGMRLLRRNRAGGSRSAAKPAVE